MSLGQFSSARASSLLFPLRDLFLGCIIIFLELWKGFGQPRVVSNRTWTWVSARLSNPSRVSSLREDSKDEGRKSSRLSDDNLSPMLRRTSERISKGCVARSRLDVVVIVVLERKTLPRASPVWMRAHKQGFLIVFFFFVTPFRFFFPMAVVVD